MADFVQTNAAGVQAVYEQPNQVIVNAAGVTVIYSLDPDYGFVNINTAALTVVMDTAPPVKRVFPLPNPKAKWQSHPNLRKFPVVN